MDHDQQHLDKLKQELYGRPLFRRRLRRTDLGGGPMASVKNGWRRVEPLRIANRWLSFGFLKKLLFVAVLLFFIVALGTLFVFYRGKNLVSSGNVAITFNGATEIAAGEELSLQIAVANQNTAPLELADLIVEYPPGTRALGSAETPLARERLPLGTIKPGEIVNRQIRAVLLGEQYSDQTLNLTLEYRLPGSSAIFSKEAAYHIFISSTPLALGLDLPTEINNNQEVALKVELQSNAQSLIVNPVVVIKYPAGFRFLRATPAPARGENLWRFNELKPGEKRQIQVSGTLEGQDEEQKSFRVSAGTMDQEEAEDLTATYGSTFATLTIRRPFVSLTAMVNGNTAAEMVADSRETFRLEVDWVNNLPGEVVDGEIQVKLSGLALDKNSVSANRGYYDSRAGTILWTKQNLPELGSIPPGGTGRATLSFAPVSLIGDGGAALRQPELNVEVKWQGQRTTDEGRTEQIFSGASQKIKFNSVAQLSAKVLQRTGPFPNRGPVPPQVDQETTYTVVWSVLNSSNNLSGAKVTASIPLYVKWLNTQIPLSESLTWQSNDSGGGTLVWNLGSVGAGVGNSSDTREVAFQVALTPSLGQIGEAPMLVLDPTFSAFDTFTKENLTANPRRPQNTEFVTESQFKLGDERVVR